ncbi:DUF1345 domain-containing protein [Arachidicoccus ginsenosidivorans]|jgi:uncharacterized membrane protein|uniref:DUF1345 domain-containing protein n=1 Tax=Arachidicoccus ginsenosidivorans TaxID=496057 RepID=A0A5B8VGQ3_9BACT|nr:DUF1345 domain-containing protein [Arachidicoccus ginsenosidivorans]QEC70459.1 DUF1345 domain-containing protein [Arachidicoccus ginsenosidivorans]
MAKHQQNKGSKNTHTPMISRLSGTVKLIISLVLAVLFFFLIPVPKASHVVFSWDIFCLSQVVLIWWSMLPVASKDIRQEAQHQDSSRAYIFVLSLFAALFSIFSVIQMLLSAGSDEVYKALNLISGVSCMILSWVLVHTIFAVRYAHLFYARDMSRKDRHAGGLDFPSHPEDDTPAWPDFMDFAYFSFTLGTTFQVSDVQITDRRIRRIAMIHGLFSFAFNAAIIALSVNIISGLIGK